MDEKIFDGVTPLEGENFTSETYAELTDNKGDDDDE